MIHRALLALVLFTVAGVFSVQADDDPMRAYESWRRGRPELREGVPHSTWTFDRGAAFRLDSGCAGRLEGLGVRARALPWAPTPAPEPVIIEEVVGGVQLHKRRAHAPLIVACALAERLPSLVALLREEGVRRVEVLSAYRREPAVSYHHLGLALDVTRVWTTEGTELSALRDWRPRSGPTCARLDDDDRLGHLVCALEHARIFSTVITPSYGRGHDDHFHVDVRPGDPWRFLR